jgi:uncharacterized membrane protein
VANRRKAQQQAKKRAVPQAQPAPSPAPVHQQTMMAEVYEEHYSGPLPRPEDLRAYEGIVPGGAERILAMAERQAAHRQSLEQVAVVGANRRANAGLVLGFIIALLFLAASVGLVVTGHETAGTVIGSVDIVGLAGVFVYGRSSQRRERERKAELIRQ